jgi:adenylate cyclase
MVETIRAYNEELAREGLPPLGLGIGIHRGPGLAGMTGSRERREYGFVGRTVNLAARVQSLTRAHGVEILVTSAVRAGLGDAFALEAMPPERVKGIAEPVPTWAVRGVA